MPARSGFPSGVRAGVAPRPWADAWSAASVTVASNANPLTSERLAVMTPPYRRSPIGCTVAQLVVAVQGIRPGHSRLDPFPLLLARSLERGEGSWRRVLTYWR